MPEEASDIITKEILVTVSKSGERAVIMLKIETMNDETVKNTGKRMHQLIIVP